MRLLRAALSRLDPYLLLMLVMVALATVAPLRGQAAETLSLATKVLIGVVFFLHGARLSREAVIAGLLHWRLHLVILAATFALFPLLGLAFAALPFTPAVLAPGLVFLACMPSTVQSSIGFVTLARGNVAAAVCAASASNLLGVLITPLLVGVLLHTQGGITWGLATSIFAQLLGPFIAGQVARLVIREWVERNRLLLRRVDQASILLVVYYAFGEAVVGGLWNKVSGGDLAILIVLSALMLAVVLGATWGAARAMRMNKADEITIVFCGSKKSIATGVPMAGLLFPGAAGGLVLLPLMVFHQIQLMVCAVLAQRYAARDSASEPVV